MASVAIVGPDGSGKTTLINRLVDQDRRFKRVYMGSSRESSNFMLPTTWLLLRIKRFRRREETPSKGVQLKGLGESDSANRGFLGKLIRLIDRLAEEWFRQIISWFFQATGKIVVYDRHYLIDFSLKKPNRKERFDVTLHEFSLRHLYPRPDAVICLDASPEILLKRKQEFTAERLNWMMDGYRRLGDEIPGIKYIDASQPLDAVFEETVRHIEDALDISPVSRTSRKVPS